MSWIETPQKLTVVLDNLPYPEPDWQDKRDYVSYDRETHMVELSISGPIHASNLGELCGALDQFEAEERKARKAVQA